jgi:LysM repeat protein
MKRILFWLLAFTFAVGLVRAQDAATQQQIDQLRGTLQDLTETQALHTKRLDALEKEIRELRDKSGGSGANQEDLQKLADQVQEIDKKRQEDRALILKEIEKLGRVGGGSPTGRKPPVVSTTTVDNPTSTGGGPQKGYEYKIAAGDTFLIIAKAYSEQGIKVTAAQIQKANPGVDPKNLKVGQKIFIPAPAQ